MKRAIALRVRCSLALCALLAAGASGAAVPAARTATPQELAQELVTLRGKIVMVNVWATWCVPCLKEIPDLVRIEQELAGRGFALLGLSIDDAADLRLVESFRLKWFPEFRTLVRDAPDMDAAVSVVDPAWNEVVPTTYLIGRDGVTLARIQGKKTHAEFRAAVLATLSRP